MIKSLNFNLLARNFKRAVLRGHQSLIKNNKLNLTVIIKQELSRISLNEFSTKTSKYIFHDCVLNSNLIIRQYLMHRIGGRLIPTFMLAAIGGSKTPIHIVPSYMLETFEKYNIPVVKSLSQFVWFIYVFIVWGYGVIQFIKSIYIQIPKNRKKNRKNLAFFMNLQTNNFPSSSSSKNSYDLISWYSQWKYRNKLINKLGHDQKFVKLSKFKAFHIFRNNSEFPEFTNWKQFFLFLFWGIYASIRSFLDLLIGKWWHPLLLSEAVKAHIVHLHKIEDLPMEYWFSHTHYTYRPIWTYNFENKGSKLFLYFYSVNNNAIQPIYDQNFSVGYWHLMSWPIYIAWGNKNKEFLKKYVGDKSKIILEENFYFTDSNKRIPEINEPCIAVFDAQPHRPYWHATQGQVFEYYHPKTSKIFFENILKLSEEFNLKILWKKKRFLHKVEHPSYTLLSQKLQKNKNVICAYHDISAHKIIKKSNLIISMPFTSTGMIGKTLGKPSCYFDALNIVDENEQNSHGVDIIKNYTDLSLWVKKSLKKK